MYSVQYIVLVYFERDMVYCRHTDQRGMESQS